MLISIYHVFKFHYRSFYEANFYKVFYEIFYKVLADYLDIEDISRRNLQVLHSSSVLRILFT